MRWASDLDWSRVKSSRILFACTLFGYLSGCSVLVGNVKPVAEKSNEYKVLKLSDVNHNWKLLPQETTDEPEKDKTSDVAYQSTKSSSIISLNTACRPNIETDERSLTSYSNMLFLGVTDIKSREEKQYIHDGEPALETTIHGNLNQEEMKLRTVVIRKKDCLYDLMYISRPKYFDSEEKVFSEFANSLKLK